MRITILDGRHLVGRFMAFDRHMNIVLGDAEEFRRLPPKKGVSEADREIRRPLGLVLIRGEEVISLTVEGPPPTDDRRGKRDVAPVRDPRRSRRARRKLSACCLANNCTPCARLANAGGHDRAGGEGARCACCCCLLCVACAACDVQRAHACARVGLGLAHARARCARRLTRPSPRRRAPAAARRQAAACLRRRPAKFRRVLLALCAAWAGPASPLCARRRVCRLRIAHAPNIRGNAAALLRAKRCPCGRRLRRSTWRHAVSMCALAHATHPVCHRADFRAAAHGRPRHAAWHAPAHGHAGHAAAVHAAPRKCVCARARCLITASADADARPLALQCRLPASARACRRLASCPEVRIALRVRDACAQLTSCPAPAALCRSAAAWLPARDAAAGRVPAAGRIPAAGIPAASAAVSRGMSAAFPAAPGPRADACNTGSVNHRARAGIRKRRVCTDAT
jgi:small nuclear ribonucleoprotein (snRNP)-like protein